MRDINTLHPYVRSLAQELVHRCREELGLRVIITDCLRTNEEQNALYSQGRDQMSKTNELRKKLGWAPISAKQATYTVTRARTAADGWHGYGLAFDVAVTDATGKKIDWSKDSDWNGNGADDWAEVGRIGLELGLEWGGNWTSIYDAPHFQFVFGRTIAMMKADPAFAPGETAMIPYEDDATRLAQAELDAEEDEELDKELRTADDMSDEELERATAPKLAELDSTGGNDQQHDVA